MQKYNTYAETEEIMKTALDMKGNTIREIGDTILVAPNTIYKWKTTDAHLSPQKHDRLLKYLMRNEPQRLEQAQDYLDRNTI